MSCWALWQRLPLRYQLSLREPDASGDIHLSISSPMSNRSPGTSMSAGRKRSARNCEQRSIMPASDREPGNPHDASPTQQQRVFEEEKLPRRHRNVDLLRGKGRATMFFTVQTSPREDPVVQTSHHHAGFPSRSSSYIASFKHNQRINSTRQNFIDPSTSPQASPRPSKAQNSKGQFPVTKFQSQTAFDNINSCSRQSQHGNGPTKIPSCSNRPTPTDRLKRGHKTQTANSPALSVNMILPVNEKKPFLKNPVYSEARSNRYILKTGQSSSMLIDNDKVVLMKTTTRPYPHSAPSSRESSASYLAHLRRLYLKDPKDYAKANRFSSIESTKRKLLFERLEYDKRTDSILNYYSRADDVEMATAWASAVEFSRRPQTTPSNSHSKRLEGAKTSRPHRSPSRPVSSKTRPNSARFPFRNGDAVSGTSSPRDALEDWGEFLKINSRSALHERQFYLRTPAIRQERVTQATASGDEQQDPCVCSLCIVEAELSTEKYEHVVPYYNGYHDVKGEVYVPSSDNDSRGQVLIPSDDKTKMWNETGYGPKDGTLDFIKLRKEEREDQRIQVEELEIENI